MSRYLIVDVGAGTMDVLYFDEGAGIHYKSVAKSPVLYLAEKAANTPGNLLVAGVEMGGGSISQVLKERARDDRIIMTASAALTVQHNLDRVRSLGIEIVKDSEASRLEASGDFNVVTVGDVETDRLERIVEGLGVPFDFDVIGFCAQDHGMPPEGVSHLDYRHNIFEERLERNPHPHALLYRGDEVPATFNRLRSIAESASTLPAREVYVMDSGMAAILGASFDPKALQKDRILVLDIATSHTVGAAVWGGELAGFFEYHTNEITLEKLESLLCGLADGKLEHRRVLEEGGHGAYIRRAFGSDNTEAIIATGPKRSLIDKSTLPVTLGSPLGDNMMTGTLGVLNAIRIRKGLNPIL